MTTAAPRFSAGNHVGESPVWDPERGRLYWVDVTAGLVCFASLSDPVVRRIKAPGDVGGLALTDCARLVVLVGDEVRLIEPERGISQSVIVSRLPNVHVRRRYNECKVDPSGALWAGHLHVDPADRAGRGGVVRITWNGQQSVLLDGIAIPNGFAWSPDGSECYFADSPARQLEALVWRGGRIVDRRIVADVTIRPGEPDGMAVDIAGMVWVAEWGAGVVSRWNPRTGRCVGEIRVPARYVTSCAFGGDDMRQLFITTSHRDLGRRQRTLEPHAGDVFAVELPVPGLAPAVFRTT